MTLNQAIQRADELRPNSLERELKVGWVRELEGQVAEFMNLPFEGAEEDAPLLMQAPFDNIYYLYVAAMIDIAQQDSDLYYNDSVLFNASFNRAKSSYIRRNLPADNGNWRVL